MSSVYVDEPLLFLYAPAVAVCRNQVFVMATFWWLIALRKPFMAILLSWKSMESLPLNVFN
ncbi:hypothetical protein APT79_14310 [Enterobacter sp. K66-74]|nr:hypothetical protein APT79_14310 [Enterobacter sp. K66-74]OJX48466.1 MAG: hypothetical protein BGO85_17595 [Enterobacter sp. 56-7]